MKKEKYIFKLSQTDVDAIWAVAQHIKGNENVVKVFNGISSKLDKFISHDIEHVNIAGNVYFK